MRNKNEKLVKAKLILAILFIFMFLIMPCKIYSQSQNQTPQNPAQENEKSKVKAEEAFKRGVELFNQEKYVGALEEFRKSYALAPKPLVLYNIGICQYFLFQYESSIETFKKYLLEAKKIPPDKRKKVEELIKEMESKSAKVTIVTEPAEANVMIDGKISLTTPVKEPVILGPGEHKVEVKKDGYNSSIQSVVLTEGMTKTIEIRLEKILEEKGTETKGVAENAKGADLKKGVISVSSSSPDAFGSIDGGEKRKLPAEFEVTAGKHIVKVEAEGMIPEIKEISVSGGQEIFLDVSLKSKGKEAQKEGVEKGKPFYKSAWFWSVIGVVVAGGAGAGIYFGVSQRGGGGSNIILEVHPK